MTLAKDFTKANAALIGMAALTQSGLSITVATLTAMLSPLALKHIWDMHKESSETRHRLYFDQNLMVLKKRGSQQHYRNEWKANIEDVYIGITHRAPEDNRERMTKHLEMHGGMLNNETFADFLPEQDMLEIAGQLNAIIKAYKAQYALERRQSDTSHAGAFQPER